MSAVAYLASYLSRAKFLSSSLVAEIVGRLVDWCSEYCQLLDGEEKAINPKAYRVFYSRCQAFGGIERLDMFFPFDPYMLKESDRFIRPNFEFWSTVRTAYGIYSSEDEDGDIDEDIVNGKNGIFDKPDLLNDVERLDGGHSDVDSDDDIECSMNKMSITPKSSLKYNPTGNFEMLTQMPVKIRPSMSPDW